MRPTGWRKAEAARGLRLAMAAVFASSPLVAQGVTATVRVHLPVTNAHTRLHVGSSVTDFGTLGSVEFAAGAVSLPGPSFQVKSNAPFSVLLASATATIGPGAKPAGDVHWSLSPGGPWTPLATTDANAVASATGGLSNHQLWFRMALNLGSDIPGSYQLTVRLTLAAP